jgi:5-methylcytosine-specific restriction enzyme A
VVIIITGEEGLEHGYADRYRGDGVFEYFGEGHGPRDGSVVSSSA